MVYSTALRVGNGNRHFAEDITQEVFTDVARRAKDLQTHEALAGWLCRHTFFTASKSIRGEQRRALREQNAMIMDHEDNPATTSRNLDEELDPALNELD